jgi:SAM-dependent methyltransferase
VQRDRENEVRSLKSVLSRVVRPGNWRRSRIRWRRGEDPAGLTWGEVLTGDAFAAKIERDFDPAKDVLELGPGYGRITKSCANFPFRSYTGVDISRRNIELLKAEYRDPRFRFIVGDFETMPIPGGPFGLVYSSLTFKHIYPTFAAAVENVAKYMLRGGVIAFDLIEGTSPGYFEKEDNVTYIRQYTREEVAKILDELGFGGLEFDYVEHMPGRSRLLVTAYKT